MAEPSTKTETENDLKPLLIPIRDVAKILGISSRSVWRMLSTGQIIRPVRIGGSVRWNREEVEQWVTHGCPPVNPLPRKPK